VDWWLRVKDIGFAVERLRVQLLAGPLTSNNCGSVVETYLPLYQVV